jgi:hypothetical protein
MNWVFWFYSLGDLVSKAGASHTDTHTPKKRRDSPAHTRTLRKRARARAAKKHCKTWHARAGSRGSRGRAFRFRRALSLVTRARAQRPSAVAVAAAGSRAAAAAARAKKSRVVCAARERSAPGEKGARTRARLLVSQAAIFVRGSGAGGIFGAHRHKHTNTRGVTSSKSEKRRTRAHSFSAARR